MAARGGAASCPELIYLLYKTGKQRYMMIDCGRWACSNCAEKRLDKIATHLKDVVSGDIWRGDIPKIWVEAARKAVRRKKASYFALSLRGGGMYLVADIEISGRGWGTESVSISDLIFEMYPWIREQPTRTTWAGDWKGEKDDEPAKDTVVFRTVAKSVDHLKRKAIEVGIDLNADEVKGDVLDLADRLTDAFAAKNEVWRKKDGSWAAA